MDLSRFKKVSENEDRAVLQHPQGHKIMIAKNALSAQMKKQLSSLPMNLAEGTTDGPVQAPDSPDSPQDPTHVTNVYVGQGPYQPSSPNIQQDPNVSDAMKNEAAVSDNPAAQPNFPEPKHVASKPQSPPVPQDVPALSQIDPTQAYPQGFQMKAAGIGAEAQAEAAGQQRLAAQYGNEIAQKQSIANDYHSFIAQNMQSRMDLEKRLANFELKPSGYIDSMPTGSKIKTAIGLLLGGMAKGTGYGSNPAQDYLNDQINKDIDRQKMNFGKYKDLLNANYKDFGDMGLATDMSRAMTSDIVAAHINQEAAKTNNPAIMAKAAQATGDLFMQNSKPLFENLRQKWALSQLPGFGAVAPGTPEMQQSQAPGRATPQGPSLTPKSIQPVQFPSERGVSKDQAPFMIENLLPQGPEKDKAQKDLDAAQAMVKFRDDVLDSWRTVNQEQTLKNRVMSPLKSSSKISAAEEPFAGAISKELEGRVTPQDMATIRALFTDMRDLGPDTSNRAFKFRKLNALLNEKMNFNSLTPLGINPYKWSRYKPDGTSKLGAGNE